MTNASAVPELYGLVLAGGRSSRMGEDKAAISFSGTTALKRAHNLLVAELAQVFVSVRPEQQDDPLREAYSLITDQLADAGPMGGLLAAHAAYPGHAWLVVACDLPLLDEATIAGLVRQRDAHKAATVFQSTQGFPEPLCAIYEPDTLAYFQERLDGGEQGGPRAWLDALDIRRLELSSPELLENINTPGDLERLRGKRNT